MEKTAVDWLVNELNERCDIIGNENSITDIFEQAKKLEKQQIIEAYACGVLNECSGTNVTSYKYHEKTFGNE